MTPDYTDALLKLGDDRVVDHFHDLRRRRRADRLVDPVLKHRCYLTGWVERCHHPQPSMPNIQAGLASESR